MTQHLNLILEGTEGDDVLAGGAGNDSLAGSRGNDTLTGGDGDDRLDGDSPDLRYTPWYSSPPPGGHDRLDGGAGNDILTSRWGNDVLVGGAGDDLLRVDSGSIWPDTFTLALDGGDGNDRLEAVLQYEGKKVVVMRGGAGSDLFSLKGQAWVMETVTIADFQTGAGGDVLDVFGVISPEIAAPFTAGYLKLLQRGADTVVQIDNDGAAGPDIFIDLVQLTNVASATLVAANMRHGHVPGEVGAIGVTLSGEGRLDGTPGRDQLTGGFGNDLLVGGAGNDVLFGGAGMDTTLYSGSRAAYEFTATPSGIVITVGDLRGGGNDGRDELWYIERLLFSDGALAFDSERNEVAGQAYRLYRAAFDRTPDETGLGFWIAAMDRGVTLATVAQEFTVSQEFYDLYGAAPANAELVGRLYENILDRAPDQAGFDYWVDLLDSGKATRADVLVSFSDSNENLAATAALVAEGIAYQPYG